MIASAHSTAIGEILPTTARVVVRYSGCPVCGRRDFRHPEHRRNHIAKCESEAMAEVAQEAYADCVDAGLEALVPPAMVAVAHAPSRYQKPVRVRTYVTADGPVRIPDATPYRAPMRPHGPDTGASTARPLPAYREELD